MTWRACDHGDGPEPLPPEELLRIRRVLAEPARTELRGQHIAAAAAEARRAHTLSSAQTIARRSARVIAGVAATIVVTSSLAGAQILVEPARAIFPTVSEHLIPHRSPDQDPSDYVNVDDGAPDAEPAESSTTPADRGTAKATKPLVQEPAPTTQRPKKTTSTTVAPTSSSTSSTSSTTTTTTEPDGSTTTTTEPDGSTTTTTEPDGSTTTTTEPDGSTTTTTTTASATATRFPPAWGRGPA